MTDLDELKRDIETLFPLADFIPFNKAELLKLIERVEKAEGDLRDFKFLFAGGEDVPGHADTLTLGEVEGLLKRREAER